MFTKFGAAASSLIPLHRRQTAWLKDGERPQRSSHRHGNISKPFADATLVEKTESEIPRRSSLLRRVGWMATCTMVTTVCAVLAVVGFIGFMWFADFSNNHWHKIMVEGWATRAVSFSTLVLRSAVDLQAGIATAMLAAVVIESASILLLDAVEVSTMRASNPHPRALLIPAIKGAHWTVPGLNSFGYSVTVLLLFMTTVMLQFSSTVLLSDLRLGQLPGLASQLNATYDFEYVAYGPSGKSDPALGFSAWNKFSYPLQMRTSTWLRNPPTYPAFAEYSKPIPVPKGVDDTGTLLRAFLPFTDTQSREIVRNYSGNAMVLDARVSCQAPKLEDLSIQLPPLYKTHWESTGRNLTYQGRMSGKLRPSITAVDRLWIPKIPPKFNCSLILQPEALTICQITDMSPWYDIYDANGGLVSEFWNTTNMNEVLGHGFAMWSLAFVVIDLRSSTDGVISETVLDIENEGPWTSVVTDAQTWDVSICYTAWDTADLDVNMYSETNRSEPIAYWNSQRGYYTVPDVHEQLGELTDQPTPHTSESRGVLQLAEKASWIPELSEAVPDEIQPFVQQFADMTNQQLALAASCKYTCSALMCPSNRTNITAGDQNDIFEEDPTRLFTADNTLASLFQQTLGRNRTGSVARAMSSLITILSSMAYYDQMPQFERSSNTTQVFFATVLYPQSHRGFWAVVIVLAIHSVLIAFVVLNFAFRSQYSFLGNHWQSIAQLHGPETEDMILESRMATDEEVRRELQASGDKNIRIGVRPLDDQRRVGLSTLRSRRLSVR